MSWTKTGRRFQFLGAGDKKMQARRAREWSWDLSARATWPNNFRRLVRTVSDSSGCPVRLRTSKFVTRSDQVMFRMRRRHHWSKASIHFSMALVMDHVSAPYKNTGSIWTLYQSIRQCFNYTDMTLQSFTHQKHQNITIKTTISQQYTSFVLPFAETRSVDLTSLTTTTTLLVA